MKNFKHTFLEWTQNGWFRLFLTALALPMLGVACGALAKLVDGLNNPNTLNEFIGIGLTISGFGVCAITFIVMIVWLIDA